MPCKVVHIVHGEDKDYLYPTVNAICRTLDDAIDYVRKVAPTPGDHAIGDSRRRDCTVSVEQVELGEYQCYLVEPDGHRWPAYRITIVTVTRDNPVHEW